MNTQTNQLSLKDQIQINNERHKQLMKENLERKRRRAKLQEKKKRNEQEKKEKALNDMKQEKRMAYNKFFKQIENDTSVFQKSELRHKHENDSFAQNQYRCRSNFFQRTKSTKKRIEQIKHEREQVNSYYNKQSNYYTANKSKADCLSKVSTQLGSGYKANDSYKKGFSVKTNKSGYRYRSESKTDGPIRVNKSDRVRGESDVMQSIANIDKLIKQKLGAIRQMDKNHANSAYKPQKQPLPYPSRINQNKNPSNFVIRNRSHQRQPLFLTDPYSQAILPPNNEQDHTYYDFDKDEQIEENIQELSQIGKVKDGNSDRKLKKIKPISFIDETHSYSVLTNYAIPRVDINDIRNTNSYYQKNLAQNNPTNNEPYNNTSAQLITKQQKDARIHYRVDMINELFED